MKALLRFRRGIERRWAERIRSLMQSHRQIVVAAEQALQRLVRDRALIPIPARVVNPRRFDRARSRD
jgi:hypothetical protein